MFGFSNQTQVNLMLNVWYSEKWNVKNSKIKRILFDFSKLARQC